MIRNAVLVVVGVVCGFLAAMAMVTRAQASSAPGLTTPYQLVLLTNGQAYFGRIEKLGEPYVVLTDVFYIQSQTNPDTKQVKNSLVKRGKEWHAPDRMMLDAQHIVLIEPVSPDSSVAKLIKDYKPQP
jgi:hypothetical protein